MGEDIRAFVHGAEAAAEIASGDIKRLWQEVLGYRKVLWILAQQSGGQLQIDEASLIQMPDDAQLLSWHDPMIHATIIRAMDSSTHIVSREA